LHYGSPSASQEGGVEVEVGSGEDHEGDDGDFDAEAVVLSDGGVEGAKASGGHGAEGVAEGFEDGDSLEEQAEDLGSGDGDVDFPEEQCGLSDARLDGFGEGSGDFGADEEFGAGAGLSEDGDEEDDDSHAAEPVCEASPEEDGAGEILGCGKDAGPGGGETGDAFEDAGTGDIKPAVAVGFEDAGDDIGQGAEEAAEEPAECDDADGFLSVHLSDILACGFGPEAGSSGDEAGDNGEQYRLEDAVGGGQVAVEPSPEQAAGHARGH